MVGFPPLVELTRNDPNVFEDCNEDYVVPHISFDSFVITDFSKLKRFDSNTNGRFAGP